MKKIMKLEDYLPDDRFPFTGSKQIIPPIKVRLRNLPDTYFFNDSLTGAKRKQFYTMLANEGIQFNKIYEAIRVESYGDVADIFIKENDFKKESSFMSFIFEEVE